MDGVSIAPRPLWLIEEGDIGLGHIGMDILKAHAHGTNGDGEILEAGEEIKEMVGSQGKFSRFDVRRGKSQRSKGQSGGQRGGGRGLRGLGIFRWQTSKLEGIGKSLFMCSNEAGEVLNKHSQYEPKPEGRTAR